MRGTTPQTIDLPPLDLRAAVGEINDAARTVNLVFSTGSDVQRYDWMSGEKYIERLSMDPKHVDLARLNGGAPLLNTHSSYDLADQIGVVESATMTGKQGRAMVRFSKRADVEPYFQDVKDRIIRNVSVGYRVHTFEEDKGNGNKLPIRTAIDWEPFEVSLVPLPADAGAQVRAGDKSHTNACLIVPGHMATDDADRIRRFRFHSAMAR